MKKLLVLLLVAVSLLLVSACKGNDATGGQSSGTQSTVSTEKSKKELAERFCDG